MSKLFEDKETMRTVWHDLLKAPTAARAFFENSKDGLYGDMSEKLERSLSTLEFTFLNQELLLKNVQTIYKLDADIEFEEAEDINLKEFCGKLINKFQPLFEFNDKKLELNCEDKTVSMPPKLLNGIVSAFINIAAANPESSKIEVTMDGTNLKIETAEKNSAELAETAIISLEKVAKKNSGSFTSDSKAILQITT